MGLLRSIALAPERMQLYPYKSRTWPTGLLKDSQWYLKSITGAGSVVVAPLPAPVLRCSNPIITTTFFDAI